jgi:hydrophobe/amphiphile efflux-1 (HAE1) family protein
MKLADVSIKRPVFITVVILSLIVVGILCYSNLTINDMPEADIPYVTVTVVQNGASPEELESKVTKKVEEAVGQISGVKHIYSTINDSVSNTVVEFILEKPSDIAAQEVKEKVGAIRGQLPQDINEPVIAKFDFTASAILSIAVTGDVDDRVLSYLVDDVLKKRLSTIKGVGAVNVYGNAEREIQVKLDKEKLAAYGLSLAEVLSNLRNDNLERSGGKVVDGNMEISLSMDSSVKNLEDFYNILVARRGDNDIRIRDIAVVSDGTKEKDSLSLYQGKPAIGVDIIKQSGANTVDVAEKVKADLELIKSHLPKGINIEIVRDNSEFIKEMVNDVMKTILEGCILAIIIVFLFLNEWESTLISAISLPTSIITSFIAMKLLKFSLNTMSLMALSLAVGLLIDDAIVVIENIVRHLHEGKPPMQAAKEATSEIGLAVLATTLAVVAMFFPVAMVSGIIGKFFIEFGLTVVVSMLASLFVSFTLVPMMSSRMLKPEKKTGKTFIGRFIKWFNSLFDTVAKKYSNILGGVLRHRLIVMVLAIVLFVGSLGMIPLLGFSFMPTTDQGEVTVDASLDSGMALEAAGQKAKEIEAIIRKYPEVRYIYTTAKKDHISVLVKLSDKKERKESAKAISAKMRDDLAKLPGIELSVNTISAGPSGGKDVSFNIKGDNYEQLQAFAQDVKNRMSRDPNARDVSLSSKAGKPEIKLEVDRDKAVDLGVSAYEASYTLSTLFSGEVVGKYDSGKDRFDIRISMKDDQRQDSDSLRGIYVAGTNHQMIPLEQVTREVFKTTSSSLYRIDRTGQIEVSANVNGVSTGDFLNQYMAKLKNGEIKVPAGITIEVGGMNQTMAEGFNSLIVALGMGVLFLFMVMAAQFESYIDPISIMFALPMAMIGAVLGLFISGSEFSIMSLIGIIMLMGLVAKNGILLIDFAKQKRREGMERNQALVEAGLVRLRPILMTTFAMIFGMIPLILATGAGTEMRAPMAHAVIGGLITSTVLTLFVVPVVYTLLDDIKRKVRKSPKLVEKEEAL